MVLREQCLDHHYSCDCGSRLGEWGFPPHKLDTVVILQLVKVRSSSYQGFIMVALDMVVFSCWSIFWYFVAFLCLGMAKAYYVVFRIRVLHCFIVM